MLKRILIAAALAAFSLAGALAADVSFTAPAGVHKKFQDMGNGSHAEVVATKGGAVIVRTLLSAVTVTGAGTAADGLSDQKTFQAWGTTSAGSGSATILVQGSNDGTRWDTIGTITLTLGTAATSDSFTSNDRYRYIRGNVSAISGTTATVTLTAGV